jgi:hypothetical protein
MKIECLFFFIQIISITSVGMGPWIIEDAVINKSSQDG